MISWLDEEFPCGPFSGQVYFAIIRAAKAAADDIVEKCGHITSIGVPQHHSVRMVMGWLRVAEYYSRCIPITKWYQVHWVLKWPKVQGLGHCGSEITCWTQCPFCIPFVFQRPSAEWTNRGMKLRLAREPHGLRWLQWCCIRRRQRRSWFVCIWEATSKQ